MTTPKPKRYVVNLRTFEYARTDRELREGEIIVSPPSERRLLDACDGRDAMALYDWQVDA